MYNVGFGDCFLVSFVYSATDTRHVLIDFGSFPKPKRKNAGNMVAIVGPSGMGSYHGIEGFREFSHARSVYTQPKVDVAKLGGIKPPYGPATIKAIKGMMK